MYLLEFEFHFIQRRERIFKPMTGKFASVLYWREILYIEA